MYPPLQSISVANVSCHDRDGRAIATLRITPASDDSPLTELDAAEARRLNVPRTQLRENGRYWCELIEPRDADARIACSLIRSTSPNPKLVLIETGAHVGLLRIDAVRASGDPVGTAHIDVRSVKLGEREHHRAMLDDIAARLTALLHDARSSSVMPLLAAWRDEPHFLQYQIEFVCETLDTSAFRGALERIFAMPHMRLRRTEWRVQPIGKQVKHSRALVRELVSGEQRVNVPASHRLAARMNNVPSHITVPRKIDDIDTPENQLVKFVLTAFQDFLQRAAKVLRKQGEDWVPVAMRAERGAHELASTLAHSFFNDVSTSTSMMHVAPLGSVALQRKAGYREVLSAWLRFQANARIAWDAAEDLFHAGQRDTARLYEYWLFFHLLDWFVERFDGAREGVRDWVQASGDGLLINLKHGQTLGKLEGQSAHGQRPLKAQFSYNRAFGATRDASVAGSWTRRMQPDFTLTLWPTELDLDEAEARGTAVHLHLDAKYRVEHLREVLDGDAITSNDAKRDDLLKMHAYRDAIRRTAGAYVLYPGSAADRAAQWRSGDNRHAHANVMFASDELLPSLGAFAIIPVEGGRAEGMAQLAAFLDAVVESIEKTTR